MNKDAARAKLEGMSDRTLKTIYLATIIGALNESGGVPDAYSDRLRLIGHKVGEVLGNPNDETLVPALDLFQAELVEALFTQMEEILAC